MKKLMKVLSMLVVAAMLMTVSMTEVFASEEVTAESLMQGLQDARDAGDAIQCDLALRVDMSVSADGEEDSVKADMDMALASVGTVARVEANAVVTDDGETEEEDVLVYVEKGDGELTAYINVDGEWVQQTQEMEDIALEDILDVDALLAADGYTLSEEDDCYVVSCYPDVNDMLGALLAMSNDMTGEELDAMNLLDGMAPVEMECRFDKDTQDIVSISVDLGPAMESMVNNLFDSLIASLTEGMEDMEGVDMSIFDSLFSVDVRAFTLSVDNISFENIAIAIPEEALNAPELDDMTTLMSDDIDSNYAE